MTLTFIFLRATVMTYSHAKVQGQRSVGSKDRVETNGRTERRTEAIALPPTLMRSVIKYVYFPPKSMIEWKHTNRRTWMIAAALPGSLMRSVTVTPSLFPHHKQWVVRTMHVVLHHKHEASWCRDCVALCAVHLCCSPNNSLPGSSMSTLLCSRPW